MRKTPNPRVAPALGALLTLMLASLLVPAATAHECTAADPARSCGACTAPHGHDHRHADGSLYCRSEPTLVPPWVGCTPPVGCYSVRDAKAAVEELLA